MALLSRFAAISGAGATQAGERLSGGPETSKPQDPEGQVSEVSGISEMLRTLSGIAEA